MTPMQTNYEVVPSDPPAAIGEPIQPTGQLGAHFVRRNNGGGRALGKAVLATCAVGFIIGLSMIINCAVNRCTDNSRQGSIMLLSIGGAGSVIPGIGFLICFCVMRRRETARQREATVEPMAV